jgi:hypothetical protein
MKVRHDSGETLVEVVMSLVLVSLAVSVMFAGFTTASRSAKNHRDLAVVDLTLRSYAESIKDSVRTSCANGGLTYNYPAFTVPVGVTALTPTPGTAAGNCPPATLASGATIATVTVSATFTGGTKRLTIGVRTP